MKPAITFILFFLFLIALAAGPFWAQSAGHEAWLVPKFWVLFTFVTMLTGIAISALVVTQFINPALYAQVFIGVTIIKMIGSMAIALVFVLKIHIVQGVFLANFAYLYFLNTGFEVYVLLRNLRNQN